MVSPGAVVAGRVVRSVLGPGVEVHAGAVVSDSVVFRDTVVEAGARVDWAIVDTHCVIERDAVVGDPGTVGSDDPDDVTIVGTGSRVGAGVKVEGGSRLEPGTTA